MNRQELIEQIRKETLCESTGEVGIPKAIKVFQDLRQQWYTANKLMDEIMTNLSKENVYVFRQEFKMTKQEVEVFKERTILEFKQTIAEIEQDILNFKATDYIMTSV